MDHHSHYGKKALDTENKLAFLQKLKEFQTQLQQHATSEFTKLGNGVRNRNLPLKRKKIPEKQRGLMRFIHLFIHSTNIHWTNTIILQGFLNN